MKPWNGAVATVVPDYNSTTWGALWQIDLDQMDELDKYGIPILSYIGTYVVSAAIVISIIHTSICG